VRPAGGWGTLPLMAIYHLSMKTIARSSGRSATAAAAYRAGVSITDPRTGEVHDYTRRTGVEYANEIIMPGGQRVDRAEFWGRVEMHHKRGDAVVAREIEVALPAEMEHRDRTALAMAYGQYLSQRYGVAVDVCIHAPSADGDERNHHAHILLSGCLVNADGTLGKKAVELDPIHCKKHRLPTPADEQRQIWQDLCNLHLERAGCAERVDHRTLEAQGIKREAQQHDGPTITAIKRKGRSSTVQRRRDEQRAERADEAAQVRQADADVTRAERELDAAMTALELAQREAQVEAQAQREAMADKVEGIVGKTEGAWRAGGRPGHQGWSRDWIEWRQQTLEQRGYSGEMLEQLARMARVQLTAVGVQLTGRDGNVYDTGPMLAAGDGDQAQIAQLTVLAAQAKGWPALELQGPREYQEAVAAEARRVGMPCTLSPDVAAAIEQERQEAAKQAQEAARRAAEAQAKARAAAAAEQVAAAEIRGLLAEGLRQWQEQARAAELERERQQAWERERARVQQQEQARAAAAAAAAEVRERAQALARQQEQARAQAQAHRALVESARGKRAHEMTSAERAAVAAEHQRDAQRIADTPAARQQQRTPGQDMGR